MTFKLLMEPLSAGKRFDALLSLAEIFSKLPREAWGYLKVEIETARQAMPVRIKEASGFCLPAALARWYGAVGRVPELTASQNCLHAPHKLRLLDDVVIIYTENQGCAFWGIRVADLVFDDPPVIYTEGQGWHEEADELSEFALKVGVSELCLSGSGYWCSGSMNDEAIAGLRSALRLIPIQTLRWPSPERHAFFLANDDILALLTSEFIFAIGTQSDVKDRLAEFADPGRIEWLNAAE